MIQAIPGGVGDYSSAGWKRVRPQILERDEYLCQIQGEGCTRKATDVDHIKDWRDGGEWLDPDNLRASCAHCNRSRSSHQKHQNGYLRSHTEIPLITGPEPHALRGRVTSAAGDAIIDHDALVAAFTPPGTESGAEHEQLAGLAWGAVIRELRRGELVASRVWLLSTDPLADELLPHTSIISTLTEDEGGGNDAPAGIEAERW